MRSRGGLRRVTQKRKVDWDGASVFFNAGGFGFVSALQATWLRVPSGGFDPIAGLQIETNMTLIRSQLRVQYQHQRSIAGIDAGLQQVTHLGIIDWPSIYGDDTIPAEVPDPSTAWPYKWIWRDTVFNYVPIAYTPPAGPSIEYNYFDNRSAPELLGSSGQRKLPDNRGILAVWSYEGAGFAALNENIGSCKLDWRGMLKAP